MPSPRYDLAVQRRAAEQVLRYHRPSRPPSKIVLKTNRDVAENVKTTTPQNRPLLFDNISVTMGTRRGECTNPCPTSQSELLTETDILC